MPSGATGSAVSKPLRSISRITSATRRVTLRIRRVQVALVKPSIIAQLGTSEMSAPW